MKQENSIPGRIIPPPLVVLALLMFSFVLDWHNPLRVRSSYWDPWLLAGAMMILVSGVLALSARKIMCSHKTPINFREPATKVVRKGPFRFTRNPLYLSLSMLYVGIGLVANSLWVLLFFFVLLLYMQTVILIEENYLESVFGSEYRSYRRSVRRWI